MTCVGLVREQVGQDRFPSRSQVCDVWRNRRTVECMAQIDDEDDEDDDQSRCGSGKQLGSNELRGSGENDRGHGLAGHGARPAAIASAPKITPNGATPSRIGASSHPGEKLASSGGGLDSSCGVTSSGLRSKVALKKESATQVRSRSPRAPSGWGRDRCPAWRRWLYADFLVTASPATACPSAANSRGGALRVMHSAFTTHFSTSGCEGISYMTSSNTLSMMVRKPNARLGLHGLAGGRRRASGVKTSSTLSSSKSTQTA